MRAIRVDVDMVYIIELTNVKSLTWNPFDSVIADPTVVMLAIVLTGLEEILMRSTMVQRDDFFRWLQGLPELTEEEEELQRRLWSASVANSM